jgi:hypothetical protein
MHPLLRRGALLAGGAAGAAVGWAVGAVVSPEFADVTAAVGAFAGVVVAGLVLAVREYEEGEEEP